MYPDIMMDDHSIATYLQKDLLDRVYSSDEYEHMREYIVEKIKYEEEQRQEIQRKRLAAMPLDQQAAVLLHQDDV